MSAPNPSTPEATRPATKLMRDVTLDGVVVITEADDPHRNWFGEVSDAEEYWSLAERFAHADLIVRAVNSYDDMLAALKSYGAVFAFPRNEFDREVCYDHCRQPGSSSNEHTERCKATKAAIQKAAEAQ